ncbi:QWRF motif-containing protein 3-like [Papaver somniferum]|uniref:QWRF motif-containing protein 3-like n=1 Tax=Papaver somniferum TaxID=3469 RepID=UPI000E6FF29D|nr:QWRF motif-containing protein 3-like [Papaver somniferum]
MKNQTDHKTVPEIGTSSPKLRRSSKSREVSSRFLSPTSMENGSSPVRRKSNASSTSILSSSSFADTRKHRSCIDEIISSKGLLWPSSSPTTVAKSQNLGTLVDHLGHERLIERTKIDIKQKPSSKNLNPLLNRQKSYSSELSRFEKENHLPVFGGSLRYAAGKLRLSSGGKQSTTGTNSARASTTSNVTPGRLSVDENALSLNRRSSSYRKTSDLLVDLLSSESEQSSDLSSSLTSNSRGIDVSSRYLNNDSSITTTQSRLSRGSSDSHIQTPVDNSTKNGMMKRVNSMTASGSTTTSKWALSPGRSSLGSPANEISNKAKLTGNMKPPNSPSKSKGVGNLISLGLEMFKSKKTSTSSTSNSLGHGGIGENAHQLRLLHNRWIQWRFMNAKADTVGAKRKSQAEKNLLNASTSLSNLRSSVVQKRTQFDKERLEFKLNTILKSQVKLLEAWGDMERQHHSAISETKDCLHSVVCRVPLVEGAKIDPQLASIALRQSTDLTASIKTMLFEFAPAAEKTGSLLSELAEAVSKEKLLLEECFELLGSVSTLEMQERSLKCNILQMKSQQ